jgi:hypothetical protein
MAGRSVTGGGVVEEVGHVVVVVLVVLVVVVEVPEDPITPAVSAPAGAPMQTSASSNGTPAKTGVLHRRRRGRFPEDV